MSVGFRLKKNCEELPMPYSGKLNLMVGGHQVDEVEYVWEDMFSPRRRGKVGWGMAVELPAVIELVRLAADGGIPAGKVVAALENAARVVQAKYEGELTAEEQAQGWGADCSAEGCGVCEAAEAKFQEISARTLVERERLKDPVTYPYTAGKHTLHSSSCAQAVKSIGTGDKPFWSTGSEEDDWQRNLRDFAHEQITNSDWATHMVMLTCDDAVKWVEERTGSRGGTRYKLCKICRPQAPGSSRTAD